MTTALFAVLDLRVGNRKASSAKGARNATAVNRLDLTAIMQKP